MPTDDKMEILNFLDNEAGLAHDHIFDILEECDDTLKSVNYIHKKVMKNPNKKNAEELKSVTHDYFNAVRDLPAAIDNNMTATRAYDSYRKKHRL